VSQLTLFGNGPPRADIFTCDLAVTSGRTTIACTRIRQEPLNPADILRMVTAVPGCRERLLAAHRVWIKPNLTSLATPDQGKTTSPAVLDCLLYSLVELGVSAEAIRVGDSAVIGTDTYEVARHAGILDVCARHDVPFLDLRWLPFQPIKVPSPRRIAALPISAPFASPRVAKINLAKIKTSYGSAAAFSVKNAKGILDDDTKLQFHTSGLQDCLCDLEQVVPWDLVILEGFPASSLGEPVPWGLLIVGDSAAAADLLAAEIARIPSEDCRHLDRLRNRLGLGDISLVDAIGAAQLTQVLPALRYAKNELADLGMRYGVAITDGRPCSGCVESLAKALARRDLSCDPRGSFRLAAGPELEGKDLGGTSFFIGNCSFDGVGRKLVSTVFAAEVLGAWQAATKVPGCPPTIDNMVSGLHQPSESGHLRDLPIRTTARPAQLLLPERVEARLARAQFEVPPLQLLLAADAVRAVAPHIPGEKVSFNTLPREAALRCELIVAAICHRINWDFLRSRLGEYMAAGSGILDAPVLLNISAQQAQSMLSGYERADRIRAAERAAMLRTVGAFILGNGDSLEKLLADVEGRVDGDGGLYARLSLCKPLGEDPARKKLNVFVHSIVRAGLWACTDERDLEPAVDYHIMRLYLRRGDVRPRNRSYLTALKLEQPRRSRTVTRLRRVTAEALSRLAAIAGLPVPVLNHVEWWIGRSVCLREQPRCTSSDTLQRLSPAAGVHPGCPYRSLCVAFNEDQSRLLLKEPFHDSRFY
jgi:uncharacterized protein (DUF362 family)